jgi:hypothetical protein
MVLLRIRNSFYLQSEGPVARSIEQGLDWLIELGRDDNKRSTLLAIPTLNNLIGVVTEVIGVQAVNRLKKGKPIHLTSTLSVSLFTKRTKVFQHQGPILVLYPDKGLLDKIDDLNHVTDVLMIPWSLQKVQYWLDTWQVSPLNSVQTISTNLQTLDPVVEEALKSLNSRVNYQTGIAHPRDRNAAIELFMILKSAQIAFEPTSIRRWLMLRGWQSKDADIVEYIAKKVQYGRPRMSIEKNWSENILQQWHEALLNNEVR